jgi:general stress protein YciG
MQNNSQNGPRHRGFAAMDPETQRRIASQGGRAAHERGRAHEFSSQEAREAGRRGGEAVSNNREHMSEIGRRGAAARNSLRAASRRGSPSESKA